MPHPALFTRRRFLQASGVCLGLPWLEAFAQERNTAPPKRAVFVFVPNGVNMWHFHPATTGRDYQLTPTLRPLADVRQRLTILSGVQHIRVKGGHEEWAHMLTCNVNSDVANKHTLVRANTISIDHLDVTRFHGDIFDSATLAEAMAGCDDVYYCVVDTRAWLRDPRRSARPIQGERHRAIAHIAHQLQHRLQRPTR